MSQMCFNLQLFSSRCSSLTKHLIVRKNTCKVNYEQNSTCMCQFCHFLVHVFFSFKPGPETDAPTIAQTIAVCNYVCNVM